MKIGVVGLGYLGLTHSVAMAALGHEVFGVEIDPVRLGKIAEGKVPFFEPGLQEGLSQALSSGRYSASNDYASLANCEVVFLCLGTPQIEGSQKANLSYIQEACKALAPILKRGAVVAGKSTVPIGTARELQDLIGAGQGGEIALVWNPEFLREGTALEDSLSPDRIVIGGDNPEAFKVLKQVYKAQLDRGTPIIECDLETAELVKVAANAFLATKISFINAMAEVSEKAGADAVKLAEAIGYDDRIGKKFLRNGIGFGGGCLPKDIRAFMARADELGVSDAVSFLSDVDAINRRRRSRVLEIATDELGGLAGKRILVMGISFKPDSDDMRDSPSLDIAINLAAAGADVTVHDPEALDALGDKHPQLKRESDLAIAAKGMDLLVLGTEWSIYSEIDPKEIGQLVARKTVIDGRNVLDVKRWQSAGWRLIALGRNVHER